MIQACTLETASPPMAEFTRHDREGGWELSVQRGPNTLLAKVKALGSEVFDAEPVVRRLWSLMSTHFSYRLILEVEGVEALTEQNIARLVALDERARAHGGFVRLSGLSPYNRSLLRESRFSNVFLAYRDFLEAVFGSAQEC